MGNITKILERYVQWFALGLGAVYLLYMGYTYLGAYTGSPPPLGVALGTSQTLIPPGEVDQKLVEMVIVPLEAAMKDPGPSGPPKAVAPVVQDMQKHYESELNETLRSHPSEALAIYSPHEGTGLTPDKPPVDNGGLVNKLPVPPPAMPGPYYTRWTVVDKKDIAYFSAIFTIDQAKLTAEMNKYTRNRQITPNMLMPQISRVYLYRQEMMSDGQWGAPKLIDSLPINKLEPYPGDKKDYAKGDDIQPWYNYKKWAENHQELILRPTFFVTDPGAPKFTVPAAARPGPAAGPGGAVPPAGAAVPQPAGLGGAAVPPAVPPVVPNGQPVGQPNPQAANKDLQIFVHDVTLQEGKTYRYAVKYRLLNTVFDIPQLAEPRIAAVFDIKSVPDNADPDPKYKLNPAEAATLWTAPVTAEPTSYIFVTAIHTIPPNFTAQFIVFNWKNGKWAKFEPKSIAAGDPVKAGTSLTGWTVVDVRKETHQIVGVNASEATYVLIMDDHGVVTRRDVRTDSADEDYNKLKTLVPAGPAAAAAR